MLRAALATLLRSGPRSVTLNAVAQRSHYSIGAVYQRWPDSTALLRDVVGTEVMPLLDGLVRDISHAKGTAAAVVRLVDRQDDEFDPLLALAELLFAARDDDALVPSARRAVESLCAAVSAVEGSSEGSSVLAWWLVCSGIGASLLRSLGTRVPDLGVPLDAFLGAHGRVVVTGQGAQGEARNTRVDGYEVRPLGRPPSASDPVAVGLVEAGVEIVGSEGVDAATARSIAERAGVSTGTLYRRFRDLDALLADVFVVSLGPERYRWVQQWLESLDTPERAAAQLADVMSRAWTDEREARLLLELSVAAHVSGPVRDEVSRRIFEGVASREEMFCVLHEAGVLTEVARADVLGWSFQLSPIGARLIASVGIVPDMGELRSLTGRFLSAVVVPDR